MLETTSTQAATMTRPARRPRPYGRLPTEPHARRVEQLRRAYQRELGRQATTIERAAMLKAALLTAKAEAAALDPTVPVEDLTKLVNLADRAVRGLPTRRPQRLTLRERLELEAQADDGEAA
jgi:hypothetical protein